MTGPDPIETELQKDMRLIANFMGSDVYPSKVPCKTNKQGWKYSYPWSGQWCEYSIHQLKYSHSWDWLKPVIDEIYTYSLAHPEQVKAVCDAKIVVGIEHIFPKVVEFVKYIKKQKK